MSKTGINIQGPRWSIVGDLFFSDFGTVPPRDHLKTCEEAIAERLAAVQDVLPSGPRVIGLCGLAGSGKSAVAECLEREGYTRLRFSDPLKRMLRALLVSAGVPPCQALRCTDGDLKGQPHPALAGQTPRHAMQTLGTEWGRDYIGRDLWVDLAMAQAAPILATGGRVVFEDVRFANEAEAIKGDLFSRQIGERALWMIDGRGGIAGDHESEDDPRGLGPDLVLDNTGSLDFLEAQALEAILG